MSHQLHKIRIQFKEREFRVASGPFYVFEDVAYTPDLIG